MFIINAAYLDVCVLKIYVVNTRSRRKYIQIKLSIQVQNLRKNLPINLVEESRNLFPRCLKTKDLNIREVECCTNPLTLINCLDVVNMLLISPTQD